jgi:hypothetical protein
MCMEISSRICDWSSNNDCSITCNTYIKDLNCASLVGHKLLLSLFFTLKVATYVGMLKSQRSLVDMKFNSCKIFHTTITTYLHFTCIHSLFMH